MSVNENIIITFSKPVRLTDDSELTDINADSLITLKKDSEEGEDVPFDAIVNAEKTVITIDPVSSLDAGQAYYAAIGPAVEDDADNAITATSVIFSTSDIPVLLVKPALQDVPASQGMTVFEVVNTGSGVMNWTASGDSEWFSINPDSGTNTGTDNGVVITVSYEANTGEERTGTITVSAPEAGSSPQTVTVNQSDNLFIKPDSTFSAVYSGIETWHPVNLVSGQGVTVVLDAHLTGGYLKFSLYDADENKIAGSDVTGIYDGQSGKTDMTAILNSIASIKVWGSPQAAGTYDLTVYNAWFNPGVTDSGRGFYSTENTAKYIEDGNYELSANEDFKRFVAENGENLTIDITAHISTGKLEAKLYDQYGNYMGAETGDIHDGETGTISHLVTVSGVYYLKIAGYEGAEGNYDLASPAGPAQNTDNDGDGLYKDAEYYHGTNPEKSDTDDDGVSDFNEAAQGRNPTHEYPAVVADSASNPATAVEVPFFNTPFNAEYSGKDSWYKFELKQGRGISVALTPRTYTGSLKLFLYNQNEIRITDSDYAFNNDTKNISHTGLTEGIYYVKVSGYEEAHGNYDLSVYDAWFNPEITDSGRNFFSTNNTSRFIFNGNAKTDWHTFSSVKEHYYRFIVQNKEEIEITITPHINLGELRLAVFDRNNNEIANTGYISNGQVGTVKKTITAGGLCYAVVTGFNGAYGDYDLAVSGSLAVNSDTDNDGLYDTAEYHHRTNLQDSDTDNDGISDTEEVAQGTNPICEDNTLDAKDAANIADAVEIPFFDKMFNIDHTGKETWYFMNLVSGQGVTITLGPHIDNGNLKLFLYDQHENKIEYTDSVFNSQTGIISYAAVTGGTFYIRVADYDSAYGNYDLSVYNAWFNPGITDTARNFYSTLNTSQYFSNGNYKLSPYDEDDYRFVVTDGEEIKITATPNINFGKLNFFLSDWDGNEITNTGYISNSETVTISHPVTIGGMFYLRVKGYEGAYGNYDLDVAGPVSNADTDHDGLYDAAEYHHKTDPTKTDTDGDGVSDTGEISQGRNPIHEYLPVIIEDDGKTMETAIDIPFFDRPFNVEHLPDSDIWYSMALTPGMGVSAALTAHLNYGKLKLNLFDSNGIKITDTLYIYNSETKTVSYTAATGGTYYLRVWGYDGAHGNYDLAVYNAWFNMGVEDSDREFYSTQYTSRYIENGNSELLNEDHCRFGALKGQQVEISVGAHINRGKLRAFLYNEKGYDIALTDLIYDGQTGTISHTVPSTGMYYVRVAGYDGAYGHYDLTTTPGLDQEIDFSAISGKITYFSNSDPVSGVSLNLEGPDSYNAVTDENGEYIITSIFPGSYTSVTSKPDDLEGLSGTDASRIARYAAGLYALNCHEKIAGDADGTGSVTSQDALSVAQYAAGMNFCFNNECSQWIFTPDPINSCNNWPPITYPSGRTYAHLDSDSNSENFVGIKLGDVTGNWGPGSSLKRRQSGDITEINVDPGSTLKISIFSDQDTLIEGADIVVNFDENILDAAGAALAGGILENRNYELQANTSVDNRVTLVVYATKNVFSGTGEIASVYFNVVGNALSWSVLSFTKFEQNELPGQGKFYINGAVADKIKITVRPGDADQNGTIDLRDAILILKVVSGISAGSVNTGSDVNRDGKAGMENVVYVLQHVAGMR